MAETEASQTFGISKETLKCVVSNKQRNEIAKRVGDDWEILATFIGVPPEDVDDIKDEHRKAMARRLAMMRKWHRLWGSEATHLRLIEGLRQIGRRDLIELLKQKTQLPSLGYGILRFPSKSVVQEYTYYKRALSIVLFVIFVVGSLIYAKPRFNDYSNYLYNRAPIYNISGTDQQYFTAKHSNIAAFNHRIASDCSSPDNDLPIIHLLFVGRENDLQQVLFRVARAHLVNINGAPGFGKSTLAIHVGYEIVKNGTSVRYINVEDKMFSIVNHWQRSKGKTEHKFSSNDIHPVQTKSLIKHNSRSSLSATNFQISTSKNVNLLEELQIWSEKMKCTSVLILDNCDDILIGEYRQEFLSLINTLVKTSKFKLHNNYYNSFTREIIVFDCWTVQELDQLASIEMLDKIAPAIDNETLREVAELVEGCPLALKVIGDNCSTYMEPN